jgi:DNA-3-methyladenine glycosylase I
MKNRCGWTGSDPLYIKYHDTEWGVPIHNDRKLFEFLLLEGAQAGLSWITILRKRENYRQAFGRFDPEKIARYGKRTIRELLLNDGIVRNRLKIEAAVQNARAFLHLREECGSFSTWVWKFVDGRQLQHAWKKLKDIPAATAESEAMSRELRKRGFNFVGPTICYAFMQATGMVNDHLTSCFRYNEVKKSAREEVCHEITHDKKRRS